MTDASIRESTLTSLKMIVERAVRPVTATLPRKKRMREELLAHVIGVFEQERDRHGDEAAALIATEQRFGDPRTVATQFEKTVPGYDRPLYLVERRTAARPGERPYRHALRLASFATFLISLETFMAMIAILLVVEERDRPHSLAALWLLITVESWLVVFAFSLFAHAMRRALFSGEVRSLGRAIGIGGLACLLTACATFVLHLAVFSNAATAAEQVRRLAVETPAFLLIPLIVMGIAFLLEQERRYSREWSELTID